MNERAFSLFLKKFQNNFPAFLHLLHSDSWAPQKKKGKDAITDKPNMLLIFVYINLNN